VSEQKPVTVDFGAPDKFGAHLFRVEIPASRHESVVIVEDYGYRGQEAGVPRDEERAVLKRPIWSAIADIARREFCLIRDVAHFSAELNSWERVHAHTRLLPQMDLSVTIFWYVYRDRQLAQISHR